MSSFLLGIVIPRIDEDDLDDWRITQWWRGVVALPILVGLIQTLLMIFVFKYDTPKQYKAKGELEKLNEIMEKLYYKEDIAGHIADFDVDKGDVN